MSSYKKSVNDFFNETGHMYENGTLKSTGGVKLLLSPVLLPLTAITASLAFAGAVLAGVAHLLALAGASIADSVRKDNTKAEADPAPSFSI